MLKEKSTKKIKDWQHFVEIAEKRSKSIIYRGQSDAKWSLHPSLSRILNEKGFDQNNGLGIEIEALNAFQCETHKFPEFEDFNKQDILLWWEYMQHYNAPTRLLDWSSSPYVAMYFAVEDLSEENGAFFVFDVGHLDWIQSVRAGGGKNYTKTSFDNLKKSLIGQSYEKSIFAIKCTKPKDRMLAQQSEYIVCTELLEDHMEV